MDIMTDLRAEGGRIHHFYHLMTTDGQWENSQRTDKERARDDNKLPAKPQVSYESSHYTYTIMKQRIGSFTAWYAFILYRLFFTENSALVLGRIVSMGEISF